MTFPARRPAARRTALALALAALVGCDKGAAPGAATTDGGAGPAPSGPSATADAGHTAPRAGAETVTWSGSYQATPGTLFVPDGGEYSGWKFRGDDASTGLGAGTISLVVDGASGRATGTGDGALGPIVVSGLVRDGELTARVDPKDATDPANASFTGVALARLDGATAKGSMHLSAPTGNVIRDATFELTRK